MNLHDRRELVRQSILSDPACSDRVISRQTGASRELVGKTRRKLIVEGLLSWEPRRGGDGKTYRIAPRNRRRSHYTSRILRHLHAAASIALSDEFRGEDVKSIDWRSMDAVVTRLGALLATLRRERRTA